MPQGVDHSKSKLLDDDIFLIERLGSGSLGNVYLSIQPEYKSTKIIDKKILGTLDKVKKYDMII